MEFFIIVKSKIKNGKRSRKFCLSRCNFVTQSRAKIFSKQHNLSEIGNQSENFQRNGKKIHSLNQVK